MHATRSILATTALAAALLTGCSGTGGVTPTAPVVTTEAAAPTTAAATGAQAVKDWYSSGGQDNINTISATMDKIGKDGTDAAGLATDCQQLVSDITAAQTGAPIPDAQAQASWATALDHLHLGASDCAAGAKASNGDQISKGATEISEGTTDLIAVSTRISQLAGQ